MKAQFGSLPAERHWVRGVVSRGGNLSIGTCALSMVAGVTGLEPATSGVTGRRSNQSELHPQRSPEAWFRVLHALLGVKVWCRESPVDLV